MRRTPLFIAPAVGLEARNVKTLSPTEQGVDLKVENICPNGRGQATCAWTGAVLAKPKAATLPPMARARLMDALYSYQNKEKLDEKTRLRISYGILKRASRARLFRPCFKQYLSGHVVSGVRMIPAQHWDKSLMLPTQRFVKETAEEVWAQSTRGKR